MALIISCKQCNEATPPPTFNSLCLKCADVEWEEYLQALERLGGSRFGNRWAPGVEELALKIAEENRVRASELEWVESKERYASLETRMAHGFALVMPWNAWSVWLKTDDLKMKLNYETASSQEEAKRQASRYLVKIRAVAGLTQYVFSHHFK